MCVHHWILDSCDKGVCKKCGKVKDFSQPIERLTRKEVKLVNSFNNEFYLQGSISLDIVQGLRKEQWYR
jgi:Fe2+ or Zn2+ uptake regulation protein